MTLTIAIMYLLFDIGGTNMRIACSRDGIAFDDPAIVSTPRDFDEGMRVFGEIAQEITAGAKVRVAAGGVAGALARDRRLLVHAPHLPGWNGKPLADALEHAVGVPVLLENDTAIIGIGEACAGAGRAHEIVVYMTVSTGVGGVRLVGGKIDRSVMGFEPGHQIIDASGGFRARKDYVGGWGQDLEGMLSGTAVTDRYGKKPYEIIDDKFWDEMARLLAYGLNNTIVHWSPDCVVIGGSMMKEIGISVPRVEEHLRGMLHIFPRLPAIKKAELGDVGGLHGALAFLRQAGA